jgi:signal transduction histidine kinase
MAHRLRTWLGPISPLDVAIAAVVAAVQVVTTIFATNNGAHGTDPDAVGFGLLVLGAAGLVVRRGRPTVALGVAFASTMLYQFLDYAGGFVWFALIIALIGVVMEGRRVLAWLTLSVGYGLVIVDDGASFVGATALAAWLLVLAAVGEVLRVRREQAAAAERTREEEARRRAGEERLRIARELHDLLAHNVSLINVQAGVALHLIDEQPEQARSALAAIKQASGDTLRELRAVLGVLRQVDEELPRAPTPSLARLDDLISRSEATPGITVRAEVEGEPRTLPAGVDLAAYRIVQESLTNVVRHAAPANALVRLTYGEHELTVRVADDGRPGRRSHPNGSGQGIAGMRERAVALGGELEAGPRPDGGFLVLARFPLEDES